MPHHNKNNIFWLILLQLSYIIAPLLITHYLSKVISAEELGLVLYTIGLATWLSIFIEFGFTISSNREIAKKANPSEKQLIFSRVQTSKIFVSMLFFPCAACACTYIPAFHGEKIYIICTLLLAFIIGMNPLWFYQGEGRAFEAAIVDFCGVVIWIFTGVYTGENTAILTSLLTIKFLVYFTLTILLVKRYGFTIASLREIFIEFKRVFGLFYLRLAISLYTTLNLVMLGLIINSKTLVCFATAEKLSKIVNNLLTQILNTFYPIISGLIDHDPFKARILNRISFFSVISLASFGSIMIFVFAPQIVNLLFGSNFDDTLTLVRTIILCVPLIAASNVIVVQVLIPRHLEKNVNFILATVGVINLILSILNSYWFGAIGMAWTVVFAESLVMFGMLSLVKFKRIKI